MDIEVLDSLHTHFITSDDILDIARTQFPGFDTTASRNINTLTLERALCADPRIEDATCVVLNNGDLRISVTPMVPVARVFPDKGDSYYVNASGKAIPAAISHPIDVPVISGQISSGASVKPLLPMLAYIKANPELDAWASAVNIDTNGDIVIIPAVLGHTVVIGDTADIPDKFIRLKVFYSHVMPVKGWDYYDNISLKWRGQVVATRRDKKSSHPAPPTELDGIDDVLDADVMLTTGADVADTPDTAPKP